MKTRFKGLNRTLTYKAWAEFIAEYGIFINPNTLRDRYEHGKRGDDLFNPVNLNLSRVGRPRKPLKPQHDMSWLLRPERWNTAKLKYLYLDFKLSPHMNEVRQ